MRQPRPQFWLRRYAGSATTSCVLAVTAGLALSGCAWQPGKLLAQAAGTVVGTDAALKAPPPKAATQATQKGGNFCDTAKAAGAPLPPAGPPRQYQFILTVDELGERAGCWAAVSP